MRKLSVSLSLVLLLVVTLTSSAFAQSLPEGWATADIGAVGATGSASGTTDTLTVIGAGADVWGTADALHFAYTPMTGDGAIVTQVVSEQRVHGWTKAGVMMRESLAANARHAYMLVSPEKGLAYQRRPATNGVSENTAGGTGTAPAFVKLTRAGNVFTAYRSADGVTWTKVDAVTIPMGATIYVGVAVSSHVTGVLASATFANVAVAASATVAPAAPVVTPPVVTPPVVPTTPSTTLRLLHWNTQHGGKGSDGRYDPVRLATAIAQMNPDVASLNEVDSPEQVTAIVTALKAKTGTPWYVSFSGLGNLLLSRLPLVATSKCLYGTRAAGDGAYAAHLSVLVNGRAINIWSTHLDVNSGSARTTQTGTMHTCAASWPEARIIAGDHNMQEGSAEYVASTQGYTDAWTAAKKAGVATNYSGNCDGCTRNSRIDYVFTSKGATMLTLKSAQMVDTRDAKGVTPSDHKPMLVVYEVK